MRLTKDQIFAVPLRTEEVEVPEWGGSVLIREMTAAELQENGRFILKPDGKADMNRAVQVPTRLCARQVVDDHGQRLFSDQDIRQLMELHGAAINRIAKAVRLLSGLEDAEDYSGLVEWMGEQYPAILEEYQEGRGKPIQRAEENFTVTPNGDSPSS